MCRIVFHVGYPKCGSSSLQGNLFEVHPSIDYLSTNVVSPTLTEFQADPRTEAFFLSLTSDDECASDRVQAIWSEHYVPALSEDRITVLSEENLLDAAPPPEEVFARIKSVAPDAQILIVIRDQVEVLRSYYDMYPTVGEGRSRRYASFSRWLDHALAGEIRLIERLKYSGPVTAAEAAFGSDRVHVLSFDGLFKTKSEVSRLAKCLNINDDDVNEALSRPAINDHRRHAAKKLTRRIMGPLHASDILPQWLIQHANEFIGRLMPRKKTAVSDDEFSRIRKFYLEDNLRLSRSIAQEHS